MSGPLGYSQGQLDAMARERGFPDYVSWMAWHKKYKTPIKGQGQAKPEPKNWLQNLVDQIPIHPSYLLNYAKDKLKKATEPEE